MDDAIFFDGAGFGFFDGAGRSGGLAIETAGRCSDGAGAGFFGVVGVPFLHLCAASCAAAFFKKSELNKILLEVFLSPSGSLSSKS